MKIKFLAWTGKADIELANLRGANLSNADLSGADLSSADLSVANLRGANLSGANLSNADLSGADLYSAGLSVANLLGADLCGADLRGADLCGADLSVANLRVANLSVANLRGADLRGADLHGADLRGANLGEVYGLSSFVVAAEGVLIGYKKLIGGTVAKLRIPAAAPRVNAYGSRKCRAAYVTVISGTGLSRHDGVTKYAPKLKVVADKFDPDPRVECSGGIHFFITEQEAKDY
jgi:Family of unknown function (DUF5758)/Pentapeptide repeats (8 copies)